VTEDFAPYNPGRRPTLPDEVMKAMATLASVTAKHGLNIALLAEDATDQVSFVGLSDKDIAGKDFVALAAFLSLPQGEARDSIALLLARVADLLVPDQKGAAGDDFTSTLDDLTL
jgi:hypothetical protein